MNEDPDFQALVAFVRQRISQVQSLPTLVLAAKQILAMAEDSQGELLANYGGGYADGAEDALRAISGVWRYHADYQGWADDE